MKIKVTKSHNRHKGTFLPEKFQLLENYKEHIFKICHRKVEVLKFKHIKVNIRHEISRNFA